MSDATQTAAVSSPAPPPEQHGHAPPEVAADAPPAIIDRYRIEATLGRGGFGTVYRALDEQLHRHVAIKVLHRKSVSRAEDALAYLREGRTVASLDHPNIVPVYDVGSTAEYPCYIVSKLIEGSSLAKRIRQERLSLQDAVELAATLAETLQYAHRKGVVHRDIKPANILLDAAGKPYVADFGLALTEEQVGRGPQYAGTPTYMSPEQARGEGHRVDGRSDLFSLGVVLYELLSARVPFRADSVTELLELIVTTEPRPLRQMDDAIPKEVERICFKAMSKRAADRYMTAQDMADDLRCFLASNAANASSGAAAKSSSAAPAAALTEPASTLSERSASNSATPASGGQPVRIVPKGLRSFDAQDADFFLELLPGPRDRDGLPDSLRFWKSRIEQIDPDNTFATGLLYGPSGCGKSSLMKAGLLPRLAGNVIAVYLEATAKETETRLLHGVRKRCPSLPTDLGLKETLAALRRGWGLAPGQKVLIVIDQFEQWLHAQKDKENSELTQALRQCDGGRLQCIVMVRDDFWMGATRFLRELEIRLLEGQNSAAVDLFPLRHAEKVLTAYGRAFGILPEGAGEVSKEQRAFIAQAVEGLAVDGKIICVRLALFAEMMKGKAWQPGTLKELGGVEGVGVTFLEETFNAAAAPPERRYHQRAARAVLKALLPDAGTDIKGHMRSYAELLAAAEYGSRPRDFEELMRILDSEIRLITPTDPEGVEQASGYYQLTHDYLVPSLREWLTRKQKETRRGRAELLLAERASLWKARPESRQLPSLWQWAGIRLCTRGKRWTDPERKMMRQATRHHTVRGAVAAALVLALLVVGWNVHRRNGEQVNATHAAGLVERLLDAPIERVPQIVAEIEEFRPWADDLLRTKHAQAADNSTQKRNTSLALLPVDPDQVEYLYRRLVNADPQEVHVLRTALAPHKDMLLDRLWSVVAQPPEGQTQQRLRAACALADFSPHSPRWEKAAPAVANDLVAVPAVHLAVWMDSLRPVRGKLQAPLAAVFHDPRRRELERSLATDILADYAADQPRVLADLLMDADPTQFATLFPKLAALGEKGLVALMDEMLRPADDGDEVARRHANAIVACLRMDRSDRYWRVLKDSSERRTRGWLTHQLAPLGVEAGVVLKRLRDEPDVTICRALVLSLGEFPSDRLTRADRESVIPMLLQRYQDDLDPGLHGAAEWLLRKWGQADKLSALDEQLKKDAKQNRERIRRERAGAKGDAKPRWYINGEGQTMVVIPGPVTFKMGSPLDEKGREKAGIEEQHEKVIGRSFAIAAKEVTVEQFQRFRKDHKHHAEFAPTPACPVNAVTWYDAAAYCNWLSKKEGLQPCYEPNEVGQYGPGMTAVPGYLDKTGYRLPTEAEWEYACRAGARTSRHYGDALELLGEYACTQLSGGKRMMAAGSLKPNDFGLFDMLGNAAEWCQGRATPYAAGEDLEDEIDSDGINNERYRIVRGGSFAYQPEYVRCAWRGREFPNSPLSYIGFRPARTFR